MYIYRTSQQTNADITFPNSMSTDTLLKNHVLKMISYVETKIGSSVSIIFLEGYFEVFIHFYIILILFLSISLCLYFSLYLFFLSLIIALSLTLFLSLTLCAPLSGAKPPLSIEMRPKNLSNCFKNFSSSQMRFYVNIVIIG